MFIVRHLIYLVFHYYNYTKAISVLILFSYNRIPEVELYYKEYKYFKILHTGQIFDKIFLFFLNPLTLSPLKH